MNDKNRTDDREDDLFFDEYEFDIEKVKEDENSLNIDTVLIAVVHFIVSLPVKAIKLLLRGAEAIFKAAAWLIKKIYKAAVWAIKKIYKAAVWTIKKIYKAAVWAIKKIYKAIVWTAKSIYRAVVKTRMAVKIFFKQRKRKRHNKWRKLTKSEPNINECPQPKKLVILNTELKANSHEAGFIIQPKPVVDLSQTEERAADKDEQAEDIFIEEEYDVREEDNTFELVSGMVMNRRPQRQAAIFRIGDMELSAGSNIKHTDTAG